MAPAADARTRPFISKNNENTNTMTLITVLISLFLERFVGYLDDFRRMEGFRRYARRLAGLLGPAGDGPLGVALALLPPLIVLAFAVEIIDGAMLGLLEIVLGVVVLVLCLGPKDLEGQIQSYIEAGIMNDEQRLWRVAGELLGEEVPEDVHARNRAIAEVIFVEANLRLFGVLFWFILLGPLGAALYRLSAHLCARDMADGGFKRAAERWLALLDWAPARLSALGYALTGRFDDTLPVVRKYLLGDLANMAQSNAALLREAGAQTLSLNAHLTPEADVTAVNIVLNMATNLLTRTLILWVTVLALMTLGGWTS